VAVLAVVAWLNRPQDEPTKATVGDAVQSFRAEGDSGSHGGEQGEPALGVYRYSTRGSESVKSPVFDATHDYGGVSTIVLSAGRCGERERWQVLAGRWSEAEACSAAHGEGSATVTEFHEFFGTGQEDSFSCRSAPLSMRQGAHFSSSCESDDSSISSTSRVIGIESISVGDETYDTTHVETRSALEGKTSGSARRDEWRRRSDGLLLKRSAESEGDTSVAGGSHYGERYTIELLSTTPQR
jgi:uncharacterized protein YaiE (UPF0345 family)